MPDFHTTRFNTELLGRLMASKMTGQDCDSFESRDKVKVQSTVHPDVKFDSCHDWLVSIKEDTRLLENSRKSKQERQLAMEANMQYHHNWLTTKFKTQ